MVFTTVMLVPASHPSLLGHFSGNPIVPGVVILDLVARCIRKRRPELRINGFPFVKFLSPLAPDSEFELHWEERSGTRIDFRCSRGERLLVQGRVQCISDVLDS